MNAQPSGRDLVDGGVAATANARAPYPQTAYHISAAHEAGLVSCAFVFFNSFVLEIILIFRINYLMLLCHLIYLIQIINYLKKLRIMQKLISAEHKIAIYLLLYSLRYFSLLLVIFCVIQPDYVKLSSQHRSLPLYWEFKAKSCFTSFRQVNEFTIMFFSLRLLVFNHLAFTKFWLFNQD